MPIRYFGNVTFNMDWVSKEDELEMERCNEVLRRIERRDNDWLDSAIATFLALTILTLVVGELKHAFVYQVLAWMAVVTLASAELGLVMHRRGKQATSIDVGIIGDYMGDYLLSRGNRFCVNLIQRRTASSKILARALCEVMKKEEADKVSIVLV